MKRMERGRYIEKAENQHLGYYYSQGRFRLHSQKIFLSDLFRIILGGCSLVSKLVEFDNENNLNH